MTAALPERLHLPLLPAEAEALRALPDPFDPDFLASLWERFGLIPDPDVYDAAGHACLLTVLYYASGGQNRPVFGRFRLELPAQIEAFWRVRRSYPFYRGLERGFAGAPLPDRSALRPSLVARLFRLHPEQSEAAGETLGRVVLARVVPQPLRSPLEVCS